MSVSVRLAFSLCPSAYIYVHCVDRCPNVPMLIDPVFFVCTSVLLPVCTNPFVVLYRCLSVRLSVRPFVPTSIYICPCTRIFPSAPSLVHVSLFANVFVLSIISFSVRYVWAYLFTCPLANHPHGFFSGCLFCRLAGIVSDSSMSTTSAICPSVLSSIRSAARPFIVSSLRSFRRSASLVALCQFITSFGVAAGCLIKSTGLFGFIGNLEYERR